MEDNLYYWNLMREVPEEHREEIKGGRLRGKLDIKPAWRLQILTETFGMCGFGWKYKVTKREFVEAAGEIVVFVDIDLFVKIDDEWSEAIPGQGGSKFAAQERGSIYVSDEATKMAVTDAISVAAKQIGVAGDVYLGYYETKYTQPKPAPERPQQEQQARQAPARQSQQKTSAYRKTPNDFVGKEETEALNTRAVPPLSTKQRSMIISLIDKIVKKEVPGMQEIAKDMLQDKMIEMVGKSKTAELNVKEASDYITFLLEEEAK